MRARPARVLSDDQPYHLVAIPDREDSMARDATPRPLAVCPVVEPPSHRNGHVWQGGFFSCSLGPDHLVRALAYVDLNPVRAGGAKLRNSDSSETVPAFRVPPGFPSSLQNYASFHITVT